MRLTPGSTLRNALLDLERTATRMAERQREVSSGTRLHAPSSNPLDAASVVREQSEIATLDRYVGAADTAEAKLSVIDSVLTSAVGYLTAARATVAAGSNSTLTTAQREAYARELEDIRDALYAAFNTSVRGRYVFSGSSVTTAPYAKNPDGTVAAYQGVAQPVSVSVDRQTSVQVTFDADAILRGGEAQAVFGVLDDLAAAIRAGDAAALDSGLQAVERGFDRVTLAQGLVGANLRTLDFTRGRLGVARRAGEESLSKYQDANMVESISQLSMAETAYRAALSAVSRATQVSLLDYLR